MSAWFSTAVIIDKYWKMKGNLLKAPFGARLSLGVESEYETGQKSIPHSIIAVMSFYFLCKNKLLFRNSNQCM